MKKFLASMVLALAIGPAAWAVDTCNGLLTIEFINPPPVVNVNDILTVRVTLGTGSIIGGTSLTITKIFYDRNCAPPLVPGCTPLNQGAIQFAGNFSTTCPVMITPLVDSPNRNAFQTSLTIPADTPIPPGFCSLQFDVQVTQAGHFDGVISFGTSLMPGAMCDNSLLVSGGFQTLAIDVAPNEVTHYSCYEVTSGGIRPRRTVSVQDVFGTFHPTHARVQRICLPADKNGEDPGAPLNPNHEAAYEPTTQSSATLATGVTATNQFGTFTMTVKGLARLLVPTSKKLTAPPGPALPVGAIPHFACHTVTNIVGPNVSKKHVTVTDQFAITPIPGFVNKGRWKLCVPASKNGEDPGAIGDPNGLLCMFAGSTPPFGTKKLFLNNQFGPNQFVNRPEAVRYDELCVPSIVTP
jgi:hypothetical protein